MPVRDAQRRRYICHHRVLGRPVEIDLRCYEKPGVYPDAPAIREEVSQAYLERGSKGYLRIGIIADIVQSQSQSIKLHEVFGESTKSRIRTYYDVPAGLMNNEIAIMQNGIKRRCDTVVFDRTGEPLMIVEYKAPHVKITQEVFNQIYRYNLVLKVKYLVVTNGMVNYCCKVDYENRRCHFLPNIPLYDSL